MASSASLFAFVVEQLLGEVDEAPPDPGAKLAFRISDKRWDDADFMAQLASVSATELAARPAKRKPAKARAKAPSSRRRSNAT
jgi:hypothetical protein